MDLEFVERHHPSNTQHEDNGGNVSIRLPTVDDGEPFLEFTAIYKAVRVARERFVMVKLGGGYAAHSVNAQQTLQDLNPMPIDNCRDGTDQLRMGQAAPGSQWYRPPGPLADQGSGQHRQRPTAVHAGRPGSSITGWSRPRISIEFSNKSPTGAAAR